MIVKHPVIDILPEQKKVTYKGATMRLGGQDVQVKKNTRAFEIYNALTVRMRFRHRYEVNPKYVEQLQKAGLVFSGRSPDGVLMEIAELPKSEHPFYLGAQFHPEFKSRPLHPHPLFTAFLKACIKNKN